MLCPHCKSKIVVTNKDVICPVCGGNIALDVRNQLTAENCLVHLITNTDKVLIYELLSNGKRKDAMHYIRKIRGTMDALVEVRILAMIEQELGDISHEKQHNETEELNPVIDLVDCSVCSNQISAKSEFCPRCGNPTGVHVCPKCGSANTKAISGASKATSVLLWGPFAANKVVSKFQCKDCWHKF